MRVEDGDANMSLVIYSPQLIINNSANNCRSTQHMLIYDVGNCSSIGRI
jgi:hypothetical protein